MITQSSDPALWNILYALWVTNKPSHVTLGASLYSAHTRVDGTIGFTLVNNMDYIDSRSLTDSKKASYKNLDG